MADKESMPSAMAKLLEEAAKREEELLASGQMVVQGQQEATPVEDEPPATEQEPADIPSQEVADDGGDLGPQIEWEQRFQSLEGKLARSADALKERDAKIEALMEELKQREQEAPKPQPAQPQQPPQMQTNANHQQIYAAMRESYPDIAMFGEAIVADLQDWVMQVIAKTVPAGIAEEVGQVKKTQEQLLQDSYLTRQRTARKAVKDAIPQLQEIHSDTRFAEWLEQVDERVGRTHREMFNEADSECNALRMTAIINEFLKSYPSKGSAPKSMASRVAPGAGGASREAAPLPKRAPTAEDLKVLSKQMTSGKLSPAEFAAATAALEASLLGGS